MGAYPDPAGPAAPKADQRRLGGHRHSRYTRAGCPKTFARSSGHPRTLDTLCAGPAQRRR
ncbi:hypothetical protein FRAAL6866 [Frankia alni ACN14a]|uniref:Uncharacterized protein n=1 Tax=Frankia alni (strain DSM 45986 / CECT 9034 / ACN14a) TaxID=326424 RepID=Q0RAQ1_FRAAA|nr:hypothetical protein FRAAL6866 [Frankia alni ACN14a]